MSAILNFAFDENLFRAVSIDGEAWFVAADACKCLGLKAENGKFTDHIKKLDDDEKRLAHRSILKSMTTGGLNPPVWPDTPGLNPGVSAADAVSPAIKEGFQKFFNAKFVDISDPLVADPASGVWLINKPGIYRLVFSSRKPFAERFKRWLAHEVIPSIEKTGHYGPKPDEQRADPPAIDGELPLAERVHRLKVVMAAYRVHGRVRAIQMWQQLGLPPVPDAPRTPRDDGYDCIAHLLQASVVLDQPSIRDLIEAALDEDEQARALLVSVGIKPYPHEDGVLLANNHPALNTIFADTPWDHGYYARALRRLPGVTPMSGFIGKKQRGTWIPASLFDKPRLANVA